MSGNNDSDGDSPTLRVGDVEKEREIERRLRELGLWENKRLLESRVTSMLEARIQEKDALSRTLRNCRRKRSAGDGCSGGGRAAIDEIRNIICPRVIRDRYGQRLAYHVDVLMGCFTRDVRHDLVDDRVVVICGSTAGDDDPTRLTKEIRLELPPDLNMAELRVSYAAGAVKIRVPYIFEDLPRSRNASSGNSVDRQARFSSISPLYSLNKQLNNRRKLGGSGSGEGGGGGYDSPPADHSPNVVNAASSTGTESNSSPGSVNFETRSLGDDLQLLSPYPVFEEEPKEERTLPGNDSFDPSSNRTPNYSTDENLLINGDNYRLRSDSAGDSDSVSLLLGRLTPLPSFENHRFRQPGHDTSDVVASNAEFRGNETLNKSSRSRSKAMGSMGNNRKNSVLSNSDFKASDFDEETSNTALGDYKTETYPPSSSRTTLNSETADETFESAGGTRIRTVDGFSVTDSKSDEASIVRKTKDSSLESNGHDSGTFSPGGRRSVAEENCSDEDANATESDFLDSDRSSTSHDRQSVLARNNNSLYENELTAMNGRKNATEGTFNNNNYSHNRRRISPSDISDASGLTRDATEATNGVVTNDVPFNALMSESTLVGRGSIAIGESKIGNFNGTTSLPESDRNAELRSFEAPQTKFGPTKLNGEEAGGKDYSGSFEERSTSDGKDAFGHHQRPTEGRAKVSGHQPSTGEHHQSTVGQVAGAVGSIGGRTRTKRSRANLNLILDSLDETFL